MRVIDDRLIISPQDVIAELECSHRLHLEWSVINDLLPAPTVEKSAELELLADQGRAHEARIVEKLRSSGTFRNIGEPSFTHAALEEAANRTKAAAEEGVDTIYQAAFYTNGMMGFADFLILQRDDNGAPLRDLSGRNIYNPVDAKSARSAKRAAALQVATYAALMKEIGYATPLQVHLWLGGEREWNAPASDLLDLAEFFIERVRNRVSGFSAKPEPLWAPPRESCVRCRWATSCDTGRHDALDISLVQGIRSTTRSALVAHGMSTLQELAGAKDEMRPIEPKEVSRETFANLREQADIQLRGLGLPKPLFEVRDATALELLPNADAGDIWFDMEGDPFAHEGDGLEYMFGVLALSTLVPDSTHFLTFDAKNRDEEKLAFKGFIEYVLERKAKYPNMHIYHYASYEVSAMLRLAQRHGILEFEVDQLVRKGTFIDLYSIVRKAFRFSTESLSIKYIEKLFWEQERDIDVKTAVGSVIEFERALGVLAEGDKEQFEAIVEEIRKYNHDDVKSTRALDLWLRTQAAALGVITRVRAEDESFEVSDEPELERVEPIALQLQRYLPEKLENWDELHRGISLTAAAISFHHREARPAWWAIFDRVTAPEEDLDSFNDVLVPTSVDATEWAKVGRQRNHRRTLAISSEGIDLRQVLDFEHTPMVLYRHAPIGFREVKGSTRGFAEAKILELQEDYAILEETERKGSGIWDEVPMAILPGAPIRTHHIEAILRDELGASTLFRIENNQPVFPELAWCDVLLRRKPRQKSGVLDSSNNSIEKITNALLDSKNSYIAVQGPPGTGKTYVGANVIANLVRKGWRIGIVAQSHAVVEHLMNTIREKDPHIPMAKKGQSPQTQPAYHVDDVAAWASSMMDTGYVIGGTVWTFSKPDVRLLNLDLMVIDEAGQFSLANSLVAISAAQRALLLGDPQQLPQVSQGKHPEPVNESVLAHILGERKTLPADYGFFLDVTYRLHPLLARPVSKLQYEDRLHSDARCERRSLEGIKPGLHILPVEHSGNTVKSVEEGEVILKLVADHLGKLWTSVDSGGTPTAPRPITEKDILIVTAYNAQVRYLKSILKKRGWPNIRVGTVDKFQGQEAPLVFVSMTTSSSEELPRGIEFLLSPNRLNVAISRAQWACYMVHSPNLQVMEPTTPNGMIMLGKFISLTKDMK